MGMEMGMERVSVGVTEGEVLWEAAFLGSGQERPWWSGQSCSLPLIAPVLNPTPC